MLNTDHNNTGNYNSGKCNNGNSNSGNKNSGSWNSGDKNSGIRNSGDGNSGAWNSGYKNSGHYNSGHFNSGYKNSGNFNSGNENSGNYNSGDFNSGFFNTDEPTIRMFNKDTGLKRSEIDIPDINLKVTEWVPLEEMTPEQKAADPKYLVKGGTLIERSYKEAWAIAWSEMHELTKQRFLNLPGFDPDIFEEITGIRVDDKTCDGKVVEIDGKKYKLSEIE